MHNQKMIPFQVQQYESMFSSLPCVAAKLGGAAGRGGVCPVWMADGPPLQRRRWEGPPRAELPIVAGHEMFPGAKHPAAAAVGDHGVVHAATQVVAGGGEGLGAVGGSANSKRY